MTADFTIANHGSIILLQPISPAAHEWGEEHIGQHNGYQPYWPTVLVEPRYLSDILHGVRSEGLVVR